jgi:ATP-dependent Clp protease ATP-binding subunit ClpC
MFERYTERARRVLFFARYEASQLGSNSIETEHLLLGLIREGKGLTSRIFARSHLSLENIRKEIEGRTVFREKVSTSVEMPCSLRPKKLIACCTTTSAPSTSCWASCARSGPWRRPSSWKRGCG